MGSSFWALDAAKKRPELVPGTSKWVANELYLINSDVVSHAEEFYNELCDGLNLIKDFTRKAYESQDDKSEFLNSLLEPRNTMSPEKRSSVSPLKYKTLSKTLESLIKPGNTRSPEKTAVSPFRYLRLSKTAESSPLRRPTLIEGNRQPKGHDTQPLSTPQGITEDVATHPSPTLELSFIPIQSNRHEEESEQRKSASKSSSPGSDSGMDDSFQAISTAIRKSIAGKTALIPPLKHEDLNSIPPDKGIGKQEGKEVEKLEDDKNTKIQKSYEGERYPLKSEVSQKDKLDARRMSTKTPKRSSVFVSLPSREPIKINSNSSGTSVKVRSMSMNRKSFKLPGNTSAQKPQKLENTDPSNTDLQPSPFLKNNVEDIVTKRPEYESLRLNQNINANNDLKPRNIFPSSESTNTQFNGLADQKSASNARESLKRESTIGNFSKSSGLSYESVHQSIGYKKGPLKREGIEKRMPRSLSKSLENSINSIPRPKPPNRIQPADMKLEDESKNETLSPLSQRQSKRKALSSLDRSPSMKRSLYWKRSRSPEFKSPDSRSLGKISAVFDGNSSPDRKSIRPKELIKEEHALIKRPLPTSVYGKINSVNSKQDTSTAPLDNKKSEPNNHTKNRFLTTLLTPSNNQPSFASKQHNGVQNFNSGKIPSPIKKNKTAGDEPEHRVPKLESSSIPFLKKKSLMAERSEAAAQKQKQKVMITMNHNLRTPKTEVSNKPSADVNGASKTHHLNSKTATSNANDNETLQKKNTDDRKIDASSVNHQQKHHLKTPRDPAKSERKPLTGNAVALPDAARGALNKHDQSIKRRKTAREIPAQDVGHILDKKATRTSQPESKGLQRKNESKDILNTEGNQVMGDALPDIATDEEDNDKGNTVFQSWAHTPELHKLLMKNRSINPLTIFGEIPELNMEEVFESLASKSRIRNSPIRWTPDTNRKKREEREYSVRMGFENAS